MLLIIFHSVGRGCTVCSKHCQQIVQGAARARTQEGLCDLNLCDWEGEAADCCVQNDRLQDWRDTAENGHHEMLGPCRYGLHDVHGLD